VVPHNAGNLVCFKQMHLDLSANVNATVPEQRISMSLKEVKPDDKGLAFTFTSSPLDLEIKADPPPLRALVQKNAGTLIMSCPVPTALLTSITIVGGPVGIAAAIKLNEQLGVQSRKIHIDPKDYSMNVPPQQIKIGEDAQKQPVKITIAPAWYDSSIVFYKK
jgi:hypothetical protein